jgi:hypothetical protein
MQYLLSEQEYEELKSSAIKQRFRADAQLQEFCTLAAQHIPVKIPWLKSSPVPWGCILSEDDNNSTHCCDECPAVKFCPYEDKEFSQ